MIALKKIHISSEMFANEGIPLFDELLKIYRFIYLIPGLLFQIACSYEAFTIQLVLFIQKYVDLVR